MRRIHQESADPEINEDLELNEDQNEINARRLEDLRSEMVYNSIQACINAPHRLNELDMVDIAVLQVHLQS